MDKKAQRLQNLSSTQGRKIFIQNQIMPAEWTIALSFLPYFDAFLADFFFAAFHFKNVCKVQRFQTYSTFLKKS